MLHIHHLFEPEQQVEQGKCDRLHRVFRGGVFGIPVGGVRAAVTGDLVHQFGEPVNYLVSFNVAFFGKTFVAGDDVYFSVEARCRRIG